MFQSARTTRPPYNVAMKNLTLLGGLTPAQFMRDYWHKKPLLIRQAIPGITRDDPGRGCMRVKNRPETLTVRVPLMTLFRNL